MSREFFGVEKGINIFAENGDLEIRLLNGAGVPGGDAGDQDASPIGSVYFRNTGELYQKIANAGATSDWELNGSSSVQLGNWRAERVDAHTGQVLTAGNVDPTTFSDNDDGRTSADFTVGHYVLDGNCALWEITAISAPNITLAAAANAPVADDMFAVKYNMPDPAGQENQAIISFDGSGCVKVADVDFAIATGINLSGSYVAAAGDPAANDTVEAAIAKLDGNNDAQDSALGVSQGDTDMGTYTGSLLNDNESAKQNLQQLETEAEALRSSLGGSVGDTDMGTYTGSIITDNVNQRVVNQELETAIEAITPTSVGPLNIAQSTPTTVDTVLVDECQAIEWEVAAHDIGDPTKVKILTIEGFHDGHAGADAANVKDKVFAKMRLGGNFNLQARVVLSGAGAAQTMGLELETNDADGIRYTVQRRTCTPAL